MNMELKMDFERKIFVGGVKSEKDYRERAERNIKADADNNFVS